MALTACGEVTSLPAVHVQVTGEHGAPIEGAALRLDGAVVARSNDKGDAWIEMNARNAGRVELSVRCPEGFQDPAARMLRTRDSSARRLSFVCEPKQRHALLAVRAPGAEGLPVRVNGVRVGDVGEDSTLHLNLLREVGSALRVSVDTTTRPDLRPQSPVVRVRLDRDEIILLDQTFERVRRRPRRARPRATSKAASRAPVRLRTL